MVITVRVDSMIDRLTNCINYVNKIPRKTRETRETRRRFVFPREDRQLKSITFDDVFSINNSWFLISGEET